MECYKILKKSEKSRGNRGTKNKRQTENKYNNKLVGLNPTLSIITLKVNDLSTQIKKQIVRLD